MRSPRAPIPSNAKAPAGEVAIQAFDRQPTVLAQRAPSFTPSPCHPLTLLPSASTSRERPPPFAFLLFPFAFPSPPHPVNLSPPPARRAASEKDRRSMTPPEERRDLPRIRSPKRATGQGRGGATNDHPLFRPLPRPTISAGDLVRLEAALDLIPFPTEAASPESSLGSKD